MRAVEAPSTQALRGWQRRALVRYLAARPRDFLLVATPGAGKTTFALRIAAELLADGTVERLTVVVPTEHLKNTVGGRAAAGRDRAGSQVLQSSAQTSVRVPRCRRHLRAGGQSPDAAPSAHREPPHAGDLREIHHGGDAKSWGDGIREAFGDATRRLALTGTPFRSDDSAIPFVNLRPRRIGFRRDRRPTTPTDTPRPWPTVWCGRWCSWPTRVRRGGATAPARSTPPAWANR